MATLMEIETTSSLQEVSSVENSNICPIKIARGTLANLNVKLIDLDAAKDQSTKAQETNNQAYIKARQEKLDETKKVSTITYISVLFEQNVQASRFQVREANITSTDAETEDKVDTTVIYIVDIIDKALDAKNKKILHNLDARNDKIFGIRRVHRAGTRDAIMKAMSDLRYVPLSDPAIHAINDSKISSYDEVATNLRILQLQVLGLTDDLKAKDTEISKLMELVMYLEKKNSGVKQAQGQAEG